MILPIVHILWDDHSGGTMGWTEFSDITGLIGLDYRVETVGFLVAEDRYRYIVIQNISDNGMVNHHMNILKKNVTQIKYLRKGKK